MFSAAHFSWSYLFFGILACSLISMLSFKLKLVKKDSELLYLSLGFYRHFLKLYLTNIYKAWSLLFILAFSEKTIRPLLRSISLDYKNSFHPALMASSLNMSAGLFCIGIKGNVFYVHAIDEEHFAQFNLFRMQKVLPNINDDNLV